MDPAAPQIPYSDSQFSTQETWMIYPRLGDATSRKRKTPRWFLTCSKPQAGDRTDVLRHWVFSSPGLFAKEQSRWKKNHVKEHYIFPSCSRGKALILSKGPRSQARRGK